MAEAKRTVTELIGQMPEVDKPDQASKFTGPSPDVAGRIFADILGGGRESILELIGLMRDPTDSDFQNYKAGYVLHGVALHAGRPGMEAQRKLLSETLTSQLGDDKLSTGVKGALIRELQVIGGKEAVSALAQQLASDALCEYAAQALLAIRDGAAEHFRKALPIAKGKNRVTIVQALGVLRDGESVAILMKTAGAEDRDARVAAVWALANVGDASAVEAVIKASSSAEGWERIQTAKACLLLAERLIASGNKGAASRLYQHLRDTRKDPSEGYLREIAEKALTSA